MRALSAAKLLDLWEQGVRRGAIDRALALLEATYPEQSVEALAALAVGERDARLLRLRQVLFGPRVTCTTQCPRCSERLEWESEVAALCIEEQQASNSELSVETETCRLKFRLPTSADLAALSGEAESLDSRRRRLVARCLVEATDADGAVLTMEQLPEAAVQEMVQAMERADPQADLEVDLNCPACGHGWAALFDIGSFLWAEIEHWAGRTLRAVHLLARAYGWSEADILAINPTRRQIYLELAGR